MKVDCNCKVKQNVTSVISEGNFKTYIVSSFINSKSKDKKNTDQ